MFNNNNTQFDPQMYMGQFGLNEISSTQLANLQNNNFGNQANINGEQSGIQNLLFNAPTFNKNGTAMKGGLNLDGLGLIGNTLGSLGMLYNSFQQSKLAKKQFGLQEEAYRTNMNNTVSNYNTTLEDRANSRFHQQNGSAAERDTYIDKNRLTA